MTIFPKLMNNCKENLMLCRFERTKSKWRRYSLEVAASAHSKPIPPHNENNFLEISMAELNDYMKRKGQPLPRLIFDYDEYQMLSMGWENHKHSKYSCIALFSNNDETRLTLHFMKKDNIKCKMVLQVCYKCIKRVYICIIIHETDMVLGNRQHVYVRGDEPQVEK
jgi:hypothetical protein